MISLILLTHGHLCDALYQTSKLMLGDQENVDCLSTANLPPGEVAAQILDIVAKRREDGKTLIAVDLKGGSTWNVACKLAHEHPDMAVISGLNLPVLLTFFNHRRTLSLDQMVEKLMTAGKSSIDAFPPGSQGK